ncbi:MAG: hypothetical protein Kow00109_07340 [Acidobacteriota bacterium]
MREAVWVLFGLAALAFLVGAGARFLGDGTVLGHPAVTYWRGAIGFLGFAAVLVLIQIRDRR